MTVHGLSSSAREAANGSGRILSRREVALLVAICLYSLIPVLGGLLRVLELTGGSVGLPVNERAEAMPVPIIAHILASAAFCLGGALQFLPGIRRRRPAGHRALGWVVICCGAVAAGSGLWMTLFYSFPLELQGVVLYVTRLAVGLLMMAFLGGAILANLSQDYQRHGALMLRAYALGQGASTQTFFGLAWMLLSGSELLGTARDGMMVSGWLFNTLCAELLIFRYLRRPVSVLSQRM